MVPCNLSLFYVYLLFFQDIKIQMVPLNIVRVFCVLVLGLCVLERFVSNCSSRYFHLEHQTNQ